MEEDMKKKVEILRLTVITDGEKIDFDLAVSGGFVGMMQGNEKLIFKAEAAKLVQVVGKIAVRQMGLDGEKLNKTLRGWTLE
jgi:hypothetical protein